MTTSDMNNELVELRERVVRLETRVEEINRRLDGFAKYMRELYDYLQKQQSRPLL